MWGSWLGWFWLLLSKITVVYSFRANDWTQRSLWSYSLAVGGNFKPNLSLTIIVQALLPCINYTNQRLLKSGIFYQTARPLSVCCQLPLKPFWWPSQLRRETGLRSVTAWAEKQSQPSLYLQGYEVRGIEGTYRYPTITYYWTVPLILDHSYLVGNLTNSKVPETKALEPLKSWQFCISEFVDFPTRYEWSKIGGTVQ